MIRQIGSA